ncbi:prohead protease [Defluviimonas sp. 20V17]|uniref:Sec-independent protein translocase protein TatA n=1 Tax=Allgaiera indica TaxID=765699 RepID=A0AAN4URV0_9RHOB|nr:twin-arginine translocase TatA/TatE family subunit [Allgaiera indica]KDB02368.1 prohead protease [Defluviimonas sp. 20V17]GHE02239.1 hypothetical protein GCM10008024_21060 [Allgaiera indica]SDX07152.1 sec-independent protein translocase protein TatA [Allgaiera indica]
MDGLSLGHVLVIGIAVLVLFGRGKVSSLMGEVGRGMTAFRNGLKAEPEPDSATTQVKTDS